MKVLYVTSEASPFVKTGGLGDVAGSLPSALRKKGVDARVILPLYRCIEQKYKDQMKYLNHIYIDMAWRKQYCGVFELEYDGTIFYFVDNEYYFNGDKPYDYIHYDCEKFIFFSKAVLSLLPTLGFRPDVINCNDWQSACVAVYLDTFRDNPFYREIKTVMTIHNLKFQGRWDLEKIKDVMGISDYYFTDDKLEYYKDANLLKGGLVYANKITTVSKSYAQEITTPQYSEGLEGILQARRNDITGIVNGISYKEWDSQKDPMIYYNYSVKDVIKGKKKNKVKLQEDLNLPVDENKFLVGIVSRLTDQKGFDLVASAMERICEGGMQVVILGTGDEKYENLFRHYSWKYPDKVSANIFFSTQMSHKIYAACDAFLMPSLFEPCGLSQLISMRYGTLPIVRETGGLRDTVTPYNEFTGEGNGFSFKNADPNDMFHVLSLSMDIYYNNPKAWENIVKNAMECDSSWDISAKEYINLYQELTGINLLQEEEQKKPAPKKKEEPLKKAAESKKKETTSAKKSVAVKKEEAAKKTISEKKEPAKKKAATPKKKSVAVKKEETANEGVVKGKDETKSKKAQTKK